MKRSLCPSAVKKRPLHDLFDDANKRKAARTALRTITNGYNDESGDESCVEIVEKKEKSDEYAGFSHEERIQAILKKPFIIPIPGYVSRGYGTLGGRGGGVRSSKFDPLAEGALVLFAPPELTVSETLGMDMNKVQVHVVVDPVLQEVLRPHQREGVKFMYDCVTGVQIEDNFGCIMADEMGLGKTLQCITLLWTLLQQGPDCKPIIEKAVIVAPSSLVKNWGNEIKKWLQARLTPKVIDGGAEVAQEVKSFMNSSGRRVPYPVLIISYETFRIHSKILNSGEIGLVICDEGHRLKNKDNQTYLALNEMKCTRRLLLSGTPIQNDLLEYFSLINFVNGGILGTDKEFKKRFENPILRGRDGDASADHQRIGNERQNELIQIVKRCMIRRTSDILSKYLPTKHDYIVCVAFTDFQKDLYTKFISSKAVAAVAAAADGNSSSKKTGGQSTLKAITFLKKLCNHPSLVYDNLAAGDFGIQGIPQELHKDSRSKIKPELSGKMQFLDTLLAHIKTTTTDKVVLISNYTQTLDLFEDLCRLRSYNFVRLDGSMTVKKRSKIVDAFNAPTSSDFIFMLSSKAGGCGLNLIGANRLVMFDPDWNPANDAQAMARNWRDGQKKECYVYRLLGQGSIEEKVFQRQAHKKALSSTLVDEVEEVERHFSVADLKDLFRLETGFASHTHEKLKCKRCSNGMQLVEPLSTADSNSDLKDWHHCHDKKRVQDIVLKFAWDENVSFAFYQKSHEQRKTV